MQRLAPAAGGGAVRCAMRCTMHGQLRGPVHQQLDLRTLRLELAPVQILDSIH
jgi:hypothetical protein